MHNSVKQLYLLETVSQVVMAFPKRNHQFGQSYSSLVLASSEGKVDGCDISRWSLEILSRNKTPLLSIQRSPETISETFKKGHSTLKIHNVVSFQLSLTPTGTWEIHAHSKAQRSYVCTDWQLLALVLSM